jgi:hypothetical protein
MSKEEIVARVASVIADIMTQAKSIVLAVMSSDIGVNKKVGKNTLVDSDIFNSVGVKSDDIEVVTLLVNDYIDYIENGRSAGSFPPPQAISAWCGRKGLPTDNSTVFLICRSIYEKGIAPRPIFDGSEGVWETIDSVFDAWAEDIFTAITSGLTEYFNN